MAYRGWLVGLIALMIVLAGISGARAQLGGVIKDIRIEGNQRIEPATVRSYMSIAVGDPFDPARIDRSLKALFATGLFADVSMRREGNTLVVRVVENPIINRIAFEGNKRIDDDTLAAEVQLRPRVVYTRNKVQADVERIIEIYRRSGRFAATVQPKVIQLPQNRVDLVFEINEGPLTKVQRIIFVGNKRYSDGTLREHIQTKESRWYRFLSSDDTYDPDRLTFDRELLRRFYLSKGYADFRVVSVVAELTRDRKGFIITFTLEEGERYRFGKIDVVSELRDVTAQDLRDEVLTREGDWYNADLVEDTVQKLTDIVGSRGFAFVDIKPKVKRDREARTINLTYDIAEGPRVFVERINIHGNFRTLDEVIRREFRLVEGDAFNAAKLRRSQQRIRNLGFFDKVDVKTRQGSGPDKAVIDVDVAERSTGDLTLGAGVSSSDGLLADISIRERNLLGRGQDLTASFTISGRRQQLNLSFTEPYFLGRDLAAGFDLTRRTTDVTDQGTFDQTTNGLVLRANYPITEELRHAVSYTIRSDKIENVDDDASRFIKEQEGTNITSAIGHSLTYDVRDSRLEPTEGYLLRLSQDLAGLGGNVQYVRNRVNGEYHYPFTEDLIGTVKGAGGYITGIFGDDVKINDRFFVGSSNLRGFEVAGIGPRDALTADALGGNLFATGSAELRFPLGLPSDFDIKGRVFSDIGVLTDVDDNGAEILDKATPRISAGVGVSYLSPFGPIQVDLALPIAKEDFDRTQFLRFSFGTRF